MDSIVHFYKKYDRFNNNYNCTCDKFIILFVKVTKIKIEKLKAKISNIMKKGYLDYLFVGIQFILFFLFVFNFELGIAINIGIIAKNTSLLLSLFGIFLVGFAVLQLRNSLSAFPTPTDHSKLITNGLFKYVRHPIYTGIMLSCLGFGLFSQSIWRLLVTALLYILFFFKAKYEENKLKAKFADYQSYSQKTGRFLPKS